MGYSFPSNMARNHFKLLLWIWIPSFAFMDFDQVIVMPFTMFLFVLKQVSMMYINGLCIFIYN